MAMRQVALMQEGSIIGVWVEGGMTMYFASNERAKAEHYATHLAQRERSKAEWHNLCHS